MKQRLGYVLVLALATGSFGVSACSGDDAGDDDDTGGSAGAAGSHAGSKNGGSSSKAGSNNGGSAVAGSGGMPDEGGAGGVGVGGVSEGGVGGVSEGGIGGVSEGGIGGVSEGGAAGNGGGEAGAGGSGPQLVYACGSDTPYKKVCSAKVAANCVNTPDCSDCVTQTTDEHDGSATGCATCDALIDDYYQCGIDAFETGNASAGMQCVGDDPDFSDECSTFFFDYYDCDGYLDDHACPATWPPQ